MSPSRTQAVGGVRDIPAPDPVARDYLLLALRLDQHLPGTVDGYFGPADLKAAVDMEQLRSPARLADDAAALRARLGAEIAEPDRRQWLDLQLVALETMARTRAGRPSAYEDEVERRFANRPERRPDARFEAAAATLDGLLPGRGSLTARLAAEDAAWTVDPDRLPSVVATVVGRYRALAGARFGLPDGESVRVGYVRNQPWSAHSWYDGGYRSRVDLALDLPVRLPVLLSTLAHETYAGHHVEHALREQLLVEDAGRLEASILLLDTPECLVSEGLAEIGPGVLLAADEREALLVDLAGAAGIPLAADRPGLARAARRRTALDAQRAILAEAAVNAALMLNADRLPRERVLAYLVEVGRYAPELARKRLELIEHPRWHASATVDVEGATLLRRWLEAVPGNEWTARFGRLLRQPLTPVAIRRELAGN